MMYKNKPRQNWMTAWIAILMLISALGSFILPTYSVYAAENYKNMGVESAVSTSYRDATQVVKDEETDVLDNNLRELFNASGSFGTVGMLYGPVGSTTLIDNFTALRNPLNASHDRIAYLDGLSGNKASQYHAFGSALNRVVTLAKVQSVSGARVEETLDSASSAAGSMTNVGVQLLRSYNPAPVLLAFTDSSYLRNGSYADNKLLDRVKQSNDLVGIIEVFGGPSTIIPGVSLTYAIMAIFVILMIGIAALMTLINGRTAGETVRKALVMIVIGSAGIPITVNLLNSGVNFLADVSQTNDERVDYENISKHLNIADWYETGFAIPAGHTLTVSNNRFKFSGDIVREINRETYRIIHGGYGTDDQVAQRLSDMSRENANITRITFSPPRRVDGSGDWDKKKLYQIAENLDTKSFSEVEGDILDTGYVVFNSTVASGSGMGSTYNYSRGGSKPNARYGVSPIAAYNLLRTSFTSNGFTVDGTVNSFNIPSVGLDVTKGAHDSVKAPALTRFLATFVMVIAGVKGLISIFTSGLGGIFRGGASTVFGSASGLGTLVGGSMALIFGVLGIGIIMSLSIAMIDILWGFINTLFPPLGNQDDSLLEPIREALKSIPIIGSMLMGLVTSVIGMVINVVAMFMIPTFAKVPIQAFAGYMQELPDMMAERAQNIENKFTGDYRSGGRRSSAVSNAMNNAKRDNAVKSAAIGAGGAAIAGYGISKVGGAMTTIFGGADTSISDTDTTNEKDPNDETDPKEVQPVDPEQPTTEGSETEQSLNHEEGEQPEAEDGMQPASEQPVDTTQPESDEGLQPASEQPTDGLQPASEQPVDDTQSVNEQPASEQPVDGSQATNEQPVDGTQATNEQPVDGSQSVNEQPVDGTQATNEQPVDGSQSVNEQPVNEQSEDTQPVAPGASESLTGDNNAISNGSQEATNKGQGNDSLNKGKNDAQGKKDASKESSSNTASVTATSTTATLVTGGKETTSSTTSNEPNGNESLASETTSDEGSQGRESVTANQSNDVGKDSTKDASQGTQTPVTGQESMTVAEGSNIGGATSVENSSNEQMSISDDDSEITQSSDDDTSVNMSMAVDTQQPATQSSMTDQNGQKDSSKTSTPAKASNQTSKPTDKSASVVSGGVNTSGVTPKNVNAPNINAPKDTKVSNGKATTTPVRNSNPNNSKTASNNAKTNANNAVDTSKSMNNLPKTNSNNPNKSTNNATPAKTGPQGKGAKLMNAVGKGLVAAGGDAKASQAVMGAVHIFGGIVGAQAITQKGLDATMSRNNKQQTKQDSKEAKQSETRQNDRNVEMAARFEDDLRQQDDENRRRNNRRIDRKSADTRR